MQFYDVFVPQRIIPGDLLAGVFIFAPGAGEAEFFRQLAVHFRRQIKNRRPYGQDKGFLHVGRLAGNFGVYAYNMQCFKYPTGQGVQAVLILHRRTDHSYFIPIHLVQRLKISIVGQVRFGGCPKTRPNHMPI